MGHLQALDMVVITAYAMIVLFIGWWTSRRQHSTEEFFLGGRGINPIVAGISILASLVSSISYLASPGEMIKNGPGWMWQMLHAPISYAVIAYLIIPRIMQHRATSAYELLEARFGNGVRMATSAMFILSRIFWMGLVIYTCSFAVATVTGLPTRTVLVAVGAIGTSYTVLGGIRAVMITDVIQYIVLVGGAAISIVIIAVKCGGPLAWWPDWHNPALADLDWPTPELFSLDPAVRLSVISVMIYGCSYWIMTATGDQVVVQRFLSTRNIRAARQSFGLSIIGDAVTGAILFLTGMALTSFYLRFPGELPDPGLGLAAQADKLFPHFIAAVLPAGLTGLVVSALFAAAMSSLDSGISSISTVLVTDFRAVTTRGCLTDQDQVRRARLIGVLVGAVAIVMSFAVTYMPGNNLLEITVRVSSVLAAPLFVAFTLVFFAPRTGPAGAWTGILAGAFLGIVLTFWQPLYHALTGSESDVSITFIMPLSAAGAFAAGVLGSAVARRLGHPG
ncbi:MAG: sodium/solute symporter [Candidatus Hydrogenedentes bacterium]|nr:sodium/solute symporter [Candidatus Hydrogenedentota bacterium]